MAAARSTDCTVAGMAHDPTRPVITPFGMAEHRIVRPCRTVIVVGARTSWIACEDNTFAGRAAASDRPVADDQ
jgi:hypothetical protein